MNLGNPIIKKGLKIIVNVAFIASVIIFFLLLSMVVYGKITESNSIGIYLFYSLVLLTLTRILQFYTQRSELGRDGVNTAQNGETNSDT